MPRRFIDISVPLKAGIASDPPDMLPQIEYLDHHQTAPRMADYMGVPIVGPAGGRIRRGRAGAASAPITARISTRPTTTSRA